MNFKSARVVVTGGGGFLGSHVVEELERRGAREVVAPRSRDYDLMDPVRTKALFADTRPDLVIHLAAKVGGIGRNRRHPGDFFHDNMMMGLNVLEAARLAGTAKVVSAGSVCSYPKFAQVPFREADLWTGYPEETNAPYGIAKKALIVMSQAYRQQYGSNFVVCIPVNLYGPRDSFDLEDAHVIPAMVRKFIEATARGAARVDLWGDGTPTREFLYVADAARGFVDAAERYDDPEPVNLGAGFEVSMRALAELVAKETGFRGELAWDATRPNGQPRRMLDVSRARERFGFASTTDLEAGIRSTVAWYRAHTASETASDAHRTTEATPGR